MAEDMKAELAGQIAAAIFGCLEVLILQKALNGQFIMIYGFIM